jgi:hypothetical protein
MDEEQIDTLRAALHNWIDQASVEQLERMNQVVATDARRGIPVVTLPQEEQPPRQYRIVYTSAAQNEERRERADNLARQGLLRQLSKPPRELPPADE